MTDREGTHVEGADFEATAGRRVESLGPELDLATFAATFNLFRLSTRVIHDLDTSVHRPLGLSIAGFRALFTIWTLGEMEPSRLALLSGVSRAAISGTVTTLESSGFIEKSRDQPDRRLITIRLTDDGAAVVEAAYRAQNRREQELFAALESEEILELSRIMHKALDGLRASSNETNH